MESDVCGVALGLGIGVEVWWPYRPQEKGSVENRVGWAKGSFFKQRRFLDRADLERGRLLRLDGPSVRTLHVNLDDAMKDDSDQEADLIRISGNGGSEFPEPTAEVLDGHGNTPPVVPGSNWPSWGGV